MPESPKAVLETILRHLGFDITVEELHFEDGLVLDIKTDDPSRLIGRQGQTLADLQYLLNRILFEGDDSVPKVTVDVGGHRTQAREALVKKTKEFAEKVRRWGDVIELEPMNSYERRIVHEAFKDDPDIGTWSPSDSARIKQITLIRRPTHKETAPTESG